MFIEKIIAKRPKPVRDKSFVEADRLVIPGEILKEEILKHEDFTKVDLDKPTEEDELVISLLASLDKKEKPLLPINQLLLKGGR